jgi:hypothetical protein
MTLDELYQRYMHAQTICPPDEYELRQRILLYSLMEYIIAKDKPSERESESRSPCAECRPQVDG